jgi:tellurite methyltransferase
MIEQDYWKKFYSKKHKFGGSPFAKFCLPYMKRGKIGSRVNAMIEFGCGNGRDLEFFLRKGINAQGVDANFAVAEHKKLDATDYILQMKVEDYLKEFNGKEFPYVYARFFWHSITPRVQREILKWVKGTIFIEARTTEDKPKDLYGKHDRNFVKIDDLVSQLKWYGFNIDYMTEGHGLSPFKGEDPHLIRIVATKK